jgi:hypothetical protein
MSDLHDLLVRRASGYEPPSDLMERVRTRRRQRDRNRRVISATASVVVVAFVIGGLANVLNRPNTLLISPPPPPFEGTWLSIDTDGSSQTMDIQSLEDHSYEVEVLDDSASVCSGAPATMTGTGRLENAELVVPAPELTCDDDSTPATMDGSSLRKALRNYTLVYDPGTKTLRDNLDVQWSRQTGDGLSEPTVSAKLWPQSSLADVREAQERATAGDPDVTWQLAPALYNDAAPPGDAVIFTRYLRQILGWDSFRWGDALDLVWTADCASSPGCTMHTIGFARCATGRPNPLYPKEGMRGDVPDFLDGTTCAPTIDDVTYETITLVASQPAVRGPKGIWVISDSYRGGSFRQSAPLPEGKVTDVVEDFLKARIDGEGVGTFVTSSAEIPLLYAASDGAGYRRFEYDLHGPLWPLGSFNAIVRLYAKGTVVEQQFDVEDAGGNRPVLEFGLTSTTENGKGLPEPYDILDGEVTFAVPPPWYGFFDYGEGTIALISGDEDEAHFAVLADPLPVKTGCEQGPAPADAQAFARSIRSDQDFEATRPVTASVGELEALRMDVVSAAGAIVCNDMGAPMVVSGPQPRGPALEQGHRMRLYLLDLPKGFSARTIAIAFVAPKAAFESVLLEAAPILDSFEFHSP